jgi:7-cyano-7-deazaguanine synthase
MEKVVVLFSGGLDSVLVAALLKEKGFLVHGLFVDYDQVIAKKEVHVAKELASHLGIPLEFVAIRNFKDITESALLGSAGIESTVVPGRNLILVGLAAAYAKKIGAKYVAYGANQADIELYPDCRKEFINALDRTLQLGYEVSLIMPIWSMTKAQIGKEAKRLMIPVNLTFSCYFKDEPCGKCHSCLSRNEALPKEM